MLWRPLDQSDLPAVEQSWNRWMEPAFAIDGRLLEQLTAKHPSWRSHRSFGVWQGEQLIAFCLARQVGEVTNIDAVMVAPNSRRQGLGRGLLGRLGSGELRFGGGPAHFLPGLPVQSRAFPFFANLGFETDWEVEDLHAQFDSRPPQFQRCQAAHIPSLEAMVSREFSARWRDDTLHRIEQGDTEDIVILTRDDRVVGFCHTWHEASKVLGPSVFWLRNRTTRPWGGIGPVGVAAECRGLGLGRRLMEEALNSLVAQGVREVVVDWTTIGAFYQRFGFRTWQEYRGLRRLAVR